MIKTRLPGFLVSVVFAIQSSIAYGQYIQCESWYKSAVGACVACDHTSQGKKSWKNFVNYCVSCTKNCLLLASVEAGETGVAESASCGSMDACVQTASFVALRARDEALIRLADYHPAAASILAAMLDTRDGVTPIDWANGVIPFSGLPSKASVIRMHEGRMADPGDPQIRDWRLSATHIGNWTDTGYLLNLEFLSPNRLAADLAKLLGGTRIQVELEQVPGASFVVTDDGFLDVPLHRIAAVSIDGRALDLALVR